MPTKRIFDLIVITGLLLHPAVGLVKIAARRWQRESNGPMGTLAGAIAVSQGR